MDPSFFSAASAEVDMRYASVVGILVGSVLQLLVVVGCDMADRAAESAVAYDSAGVKIVVDQGNMEGGPTWSIGESPMWRVGDRDEEEGHHLHRVAGTVRFGDGRVAVANGGSSELRFFDENGEFAFSAGSPGSGPGEFSDLSGLHRLAGDSLATVDLSLRRISVFDHRGRFARSFNIPSLEDGSVLDLVGESEEGYFLYRTVPIMGAAQVASGTTRLPVTIYRSDRDGQGVRRLGRFPGFEVLVTPMEGGPPMSGLLTFGRNTVVAAARSGFILGLADGYELGLYDGDGSLVQVFRSDLESRRVSREHIEERRREIREGMPDSPIRRIFEDRLEAAPSAFPPYESVLIDAEGVLWVGRYVAPGDETRVWDLVRLDEGMAATLEVPASFSIIEVGQDYVLGVLTDQLGIELVEVYALTRGVS